ncbi:VCBS repeat-containing protein [Kutzneria sp. NPDC051319]|uniref:FG-GAP repeat domain-containing protein n=1 Tax=Kutzneria sp. NPDC051319 TaxID=3155047 RepID=UPI0034484C8E
MDRAGNLSDGSQAYDLGVFRNPAPPTHTRGDVTGDGRPDATMVLDNGDVWTFVARDGGFYRGTVGFYPGYGILNYTPPPGPYARGDFNGDGRTDLVYAARTGLVQLISSGNDYDVPPPVDAPKPDRMAAGDFDGDGRADVALQYQGQISVLSNGTVTTWLQGGAGELVAGDFDGDGKADLATIDGDKLTFYRSTGSAFEAGTTVGADKVDAASAVSGDMDGDGRDDVIALTTHGVTVFGSAAKFAPRTWSSFDAGKAVLSTGDFDLDGHADLAVLRGSGTTELWTLRSTGQAFGDAVLGGREVTGGTPLHVGT